MTNISASTFAEEDLLNIVGNVSDMTRLHFVAVATEARKPQDELDKNVGTHAVGSSNSHCDRNQIESLQVVLTQKWESCMCALASSISLVTLLLVIFFPR